MQDLRIYMNSIRYYLILFIFQTIFGAYLKNVPQILIQPDGTKVECLSSGDEFYNWVHDDKGYTIVRSQIDGFLYYAKEDLTPSQYKVDSVNPETVNLKKWTKICLLYTSPSPRDLSTSRMPSSA